MDTKKEPAAKWVDIDSIKPWGRNPKRLDESDVARMVRSIERFGWADVIVAREADGEIISGHLRHAAAKSLGMAKVPVRYLPIDSAEAHALAVAVTQHEAVRTFDESIGALLADMQADGIDLDGLGWSKSELANLLAADDDLFDVDEQSFESVAFRVVVDNLTETTQADLLERLQAEGYSCQALMS